MKTIWRWLSKGLLWVFAFAVGLLLVMIAINFFDEDLAPETTVLLTAPPNQFSADQNLYLALLGSDAPMGESPVAFGLEKVKEYEVGLEARLKDPRIALEDVSKKNPRLLDFKGKLDFCHPLQTSCWDKIENHKDEIEKLLDDNRELYQRYLALKNFTGYYDTATPSLYSPLIYPSSQIRSLFLVNFAVQMKSQNLHQQKAALMDLDGDIRVWRAMLMGEGDLVSKMSAVAYLQGDYLMLADMIADSTIDLSSFSTELDHMVMQFDQDDWKIGKMFTYEFRTMTSIWDRMSRDADAQFDIRNAIAGDTPKWWERYWSRFSLHFYKARATVNLNSKVIQQLTKMTDAEPENVYVARDAYSTWMRKNLSFGLNFAYNPMGKTLLAIGASMYETTPCVLTMLLRYSAWLSWVMRFVAKKLRLKRFPHLFNNTQNGRLIL
ncbi:MAG: hypothetical protein H0W44_02050 [Gammaproteobacteria bacterium]|nr:hypothetical protein [Gammaproteobacteria bacterium]